MIRWTKYFSWSVVEAVERRTELFDFLAIRDASVPIGIFVTLDAFSYVHCHERIFLNCMFDIIFSVASLHSFFLHMFLPLCVTFV